MAAEKNYNNLKDNTSSKIMEENNDSERQPIVQRGGVERDMEKERGGRLCLVVGIVVLILVAVAAIAGLVVAVINSSQSQATFQQQQATFQQLQATFQQLQDSQCALYIRWGHLDCPSTPGTSRVYYGFAAGTHLTNDTPTTGSQCLPADHAQVKYWNDTASLYGNTQVYTVHGMEYNTFLPNRDDKGVACALCKVSRRSTVVMIPATNQCNSTDPTDNSWTKEYDGYLMLASGAGSEYYCVDNAMVTMYGTQKDPGVSALFHVVTGTDPSQATTYDKEKVLSCVVCTV